MVEPKKEDSRKGEKNLFIIGSLGAGKSSIVSTLYFSTYEDALKDGEIFATSKSLKGFT